MKNFIQISIYFIISLSTISVCAQKNGNRNGQFLQELANNKKLKIKNIDANILKWTNDDIYGINEEIFSISGIMTNDSLKKYFTNEDLKYIDKQFKSIVASSWTNIKIKNVEFIDSLKIDKVFKNSLKKNRGANNYFYSFSNPLFSIDNKLVLIKQEYNCGFMCSTQCFYIYRKTGKTWKEVISWNCWST